MRNACAISLVMLLTMLAKSKCFFLVKSYIFKSSLDILNYYKNVEYTISDSENQSGLSMAPDGTRWHPMAIHGPKMAPWSPIVPSMVMRLRDHPRAIGCHRGPCLVLSIDILKRLLYFSLV